MPSITAADHRGLTLLHRLIFGGLAEPLPRVRPLVCGRPHPRRRLRRWHADGVVRVAGRAGLDTIGTLGS